MKMFLFYNFFRQIVASVFRPTLIKVEACDRHEFPILHFYSDDQTTTLCISEGGRGKKLEDSEGCSSLSGGSK